MAKEIELLHRFKKKLDSEEFKEKGNLAGVAGLGIAITIVGLKTMTDGAIEGDIVKTEAGKAFINYGIIFVGISILYPIIKNFDKIDLFAKKQYKKIKKIL